MLSAAVVNLEGEQVLEKDSEFSVGHVEFDLSRGHPIPDVSGCLEM